MDKSPVYSALIDADTILYRIGFLKTVGTDVSLRILLLEKAIASIAFKLKDMAHLQFGYDIELFFHAFIQKDDPTPRMRSQFDYETKYKENRLTSNKPMHMQEMKNRFLDRDFIFEDSRGKEDIIYSHPVLPGIEEVDDAISIECYSLEADKLAFPIAAHVDKDLNQIAGWHYNYNKNLLYVQSQKNADKFFFIQLLMGDITDNIPGIRGVGQITAKKLLESADTVDEMWEIVLRTYLKAYKETHSEDEITELLYERGNKLWIRRKPGEIWTPPIPSP